MFCTNNFRKITLFFFFIFFSLVFVKNAQARITYYCKPPYIYSPTPFDSALDLSWVQPGYTTDSGSESLICRVHSYQINWVKYGMLVNFTPLPECPINSPVADCGSTTVQINNPTEFSCDVDAVTGNDLVAAQRHTLITGLQNGQQYAVFVSYTGTNTPPCEQSNTFYSRVDQTIGFCGDGIAETVNNEECDTPDLGSYKGISNTSNSCSVVRAFDIGGTLSCNPPGTSNGCTFNTSQCIACNNIQTPAMSNNINNLNLVAADANFSCLVQADHQGPGVLCQVLNSSDNPISTCNFVSWQGNTAKFNCTAPSAPSDVNTLYYLRATYPVFNNNQSTGIISRSACARSYPAGLVLNVISPDNTPPTVTVTEGYGLYTNENPQQELTISTSCDDSGGSGCVTSTIKLKRFDTKPTSCPTNYHDYDLTSPNIPALSKTAWFCGSAKDKLENTGFSQVIEIRPGCRDQCQALHDRSCGDPQYIGGEPYDHTRDCRNTDQDSCLEWANETLCGKYLCQEGYCNRATYLINNSGRVLRTDNSTGIDGINVIFEKGNTSGGYTTYNEGIYTIHDFDVSGHDITGAVSVASTPGWTVDKTVCYSHPSDCTESATVTGFNGSHSCPMDIYYDIRGSSNNCGRNYGNFSLSPTDTTPPTITTSISPAGAISTTQQVTIQADATDNISVLNTEIYIDGGLAKRCSGSMINPTPNPDPCLTPAALYSPGNHSYYAIAYDNANNQKVSSTLTFTVTAPSSSSTPSPTPTSPPPPPPPPPGPTSSCGSGIAKAEGLVTTPALPSGSNFNTSGACIIDPKAAFAPFKIPSFDELKSIYYDQKK